MTVEIFASMLAGCALVTGLITEALKKTGLVKSNNILALIVSVVVSVLSLTFYFVATSTPFTGTNILVSIAFWMANWVGAMVGYDKVIQTIKQIISGE